MQRIPANIIHLASQPKRWDVLNERLSALPLLCPVLIDAVDGGKVPEEVRTRHISPLYPCYTGYSTMTAGEYGCGMSHHKAHETVLESGAPFAVVLEDDVLLSPDTEQALNAVALQLEVPEPRILLLSCRLIAFRKPFAICGRYRIHRVLEGGGAYGYALNRAAAQILHDRLLPFRAPCDWWLVIRQMGIRVLALTPHVASYHDGLREDSTIEGDRKNLWKRERGQRLPAHLQWGFFLHRSWPILYRKLLSRLGLLIFLDKQWE